MKIRELRILPPLAFARLGSADRPLDNYALALDPERPLGFRRLVPAETLQVDEPTGTVTGSYTPERITFKENGRIRPVAPFFEVFAVTDRDTLEPVDLALLRRCAAGPSNVSWRVCVANRKVFRRTRNPDDVVQAETPWFNDHAPQPLIGRCGRFIPAATLPLGSVRYIVPTDQFPVVRLRFTPAKGLIYGPHLQAEDGRVHPSRENYYQVPNERAIYDPTPPAVRQYRSWYKFQETDPLNETLPPSLYAIIPPAPPWLHDNVAISRGFLDDACDGIIEVRLALADGRTLWAIARVASTPPAVVPDSLFIRSLADDLEQALLGPDVSADEPHGQTLARAEDIVRRAFETVRFLNVALMNGNAFGGRPPLSLDTMPAEEAFDTSRPIRPVMWPTSVDTLAVMAVHQQLYTALRGGAAAWFLRHLRRPQEAADYTDRGRRKMPALMCGADNNYLALTHRQIDTIRKLSEEPLSRDPHEAPADARAELTPRNLTAQLLYVAAGNPESSRPTAAIANCCPGLEVDFRAVWRRIFEGIVLQEAGNVVMAVDDPARAALLHHRLLRVDGMPVVAKKKGPSPASNDEYVVLVSEDDPTGVAGLEWSNALARVLHAKAGQEVLCDFTPQPSPKPAPAEGPFLTVPLKIRALFEAATAVVSTTLAKPGELTQGLCSPWQNDYRECSCYYWASSRPDYVNIEATSAGISRGDNWLQKERTGDYVPDDYTDARLIHYDDLFSDWEHFLRIQIRGRDAPDDGSENR